jgi:D-lyxose ketol-isomerase
VRLSPGQSVCIPPRVIHQFWGEQGTGVTVSSEVSSVCDDRNDNVFLVDYGVRFPTIVEDEPPTHYLCHEYPPCRDK